MVQITQVSMTVTPRICERWFWREEISLPVVQIGGGLIVVATGWTF
jgi:hypothetical protein